MRRRLGQKGNTNLLRAPVELTQNFTILAEGRYQTVQEWLSINYDESRVLHPEIHYQSLVQIWNSCMEADVSMTDEEIMTMLQGPLRLPRHQGITSNPPESPQEVASSPRCSSSLLLFCYYFLFRRDPYGCKITSAKLHSASEKESLPLFDYLNQYWDGEQWLRMLSQCHGLDFHAVARRQQDKHRLFAYDNVMLNDRGKWVKKKTTTLSLVQDGETRFCVGYLDDFVAVFEFEEDCKEDRCEEQEEDIISESVQTGSKPSHISSQNLLKDLSQRLLLEIVILVVFIRLLYFSYICLII
jgi:hypothetical protein